MSKPIELKEKALRIIDCICTENSLDYTKLDKDGKVVPNKVGDLLNELLALCNPRPLVAGVSSLGTTY